MRQEDERVRPARIEQARRHSEDPDPRPHIKHGDEINQVKVLLVYYFSSIGDLRGGIIRYMATHPHYDGDTSLTSPHQHPSLPSVMTPQHQYPSPPSESVMTKTRSPRPTATTQTVSLTGYTDTAMKGTGGILNAGTKEGEKRKEGAHPKTVGKGKEGEGT